MAKSDGATPVNRRAFLRVAGVATGAAVAGGIPAMVAAQKPPSFAKGTKLNILEWVSFVPASDVEFKRLAAEFGKLAGVDVTVDPADGVARVGLLGDVGARGGERGGAGEVGLGDDAAGMGVQRLQLDLAVERAKGRGAAQHHHHLLVGVVGMQREGGRTRFELEHGRPELARAGLLPDARASPAERALVLLRIPLWVERVGHALSVSRRG